MFIKLLKKVPLIVIVFLFTLTLVNSVFAATDSSVTSANTPAPCPQGSGFLENPLGSTCNLGGLLKNIINWFAFTIGPIIAAGFVIYGGFQMIMAGGDSKKFEEGKQTVLYVTIGYGILLIGWGVVDIVKSILTP